MSKLGVVEDTLFVPMLGRPQGCPSRSAVQQALNFIKSGQKPRNYAVSGVFPFQMVCRNLTERR